MPWSTEVLCTDADVIEEEPKIIQWKGEGTLSKWRQLAKDKIEERLKYLLRSQALIMDVTLDEICDHILDTTPLKRSAIYMTLFCLTKAASIQPQDLMDGKSKDYWELFRDEWTRAVGSISLDSDESGTIEDAETYNVAIDATFRMGG